MPDRELVERFCELVSIPSPSGKEKEIVAHVKGVLDGLGVRSYVDGSAEAAQGNTGNLIAEIGEGRPVLLFSGHLDTVEKGDVRIAPIVDGDDIHTDGTTVLGSDDKSAVSCMMGVIKDLKEEKGIPRTIFVFSTNEEGGKVAMGVEFLKLDTKVDYAFAIDGSDRPGIFMHKVLGTRVFEVNVTGRSAHAEREPQKGANALKACGLMIADLDIGKREDGSMLNLGRAEASGTTTAVVPDSAHMVGEFGAFTDARMTEIEEHIKGVVDKACTRTGCTSDIKWYKTYYAPPLNNDPDGRIAKLAEKACIAAGLKFELMEYHATTEANMLAGVLGYNTLGMTRGGRNPHTVGEHISIKEMENTMRLVECIVREAHAFA